MIPSPDDRAVLPENSEVVRYVSGGLVQGDVVDGAAFKAPVDGAAFKPRPSDNGELSVNQLGVFEADSKADMAEIRRIRSQWMTVRKTGRFAQVAIADVHACAEEAALAFGFWSDPLVAAEEQGREDCDDDPSHAVIYGIPDGDDDSAIALRDMIAMKVNDLHPGKL